MDVRPSQPQVLQLTLLVPLQQTGNYRLLFTLNPRLCDVCQHLTGSRHNYGMVHSLATSKRCPSTSSYKSHVLQATLEQYLPYMHH